MDFQGLADQIHYTIAETFLRKIKFVARRCKWNFKFLADDYFQRQNFSLLQVNLQKNSFTCKWSDNCWSSKIAEKTCSSIPALKYSILTRINRIFGSVVVRACVCRSLRSGSIRAKRVDTIHGKRQISDVCFVFSFF